MDPPSPAVLRRRLLTNSAAEFVEKGANIEAILKLEDSPEATLDLPDAEFMPELDKFVHKGVVFDSTRCYEKSREITAKFRPTLTKFGVILKERKVDTQLDIRIEDPNDFTMDYVFGITRRISEGGNVTAKTRSCKNFIQKCYRKVEDNRNVIGGILGMLPNDTYGSMISGGFTLIMAAVEKHAEQRERIHSILAEIPEKVGTIRRLSEIHHASASLHCCTDAVVVAIFVALTSIMEDLTKTWKIKLTENFSRLKKGLGFVSQSRRGNQKLKVDGSGGLHSTVEADNEDAHEQSMTVTDALDELQSRIDSFQTEVDICAQERLGRVEAGIGDVKKGLVFMSKQAAWVEAMVNESRSRFEENITEDKRGELFLLFSDALYRFFTSTPNFNSRTGEVDYEQARLLQQKKEVASIRSRQKTNGSISTKWSKRLKGIGICDPASDIKDCLEHLEKLDHDDKNISQYILHSEELNSWLKEAQSNVIEINLHTPPSSLSNPLSFNSALFAETLRSTNQFPVLAFFSMHRNNESISQEVSGPVALVRSLNGQLLKFIAAHRPSVDLSALKDQGLFLEAKKSLRHGLRLLKGLILSLPENDALFLIIDTLSWLTGTECDQDKVFKKLGKIVEETENVVLKIMVTGTLPGSYAKSIADISLFVHDVSSGFGGIDIAESGGQIYKRIKGRHVKQGIGDAATMTEDDDGEEDSDED